MSSILKLASNPSVNRTAQKRSFWVRFGLRQPVTSNVMLIEIMKLSLIASYIISLGVLLMFLSGTGVINENIGLFGLGITIIGNVFCWIIPRFQDESKPVLLTTIDNE